MYFPSSIILSYLLCAISAKNIRIIYERGDELANALVKTIHVSLIFYNDVYKLKEKVDAEFVQLEKNSNVTDEQLMEADFVVSFAEREEYRRQIRLTAYELNIPVIQVKLHPWDGTYQNKDHINVTDDYAILIPSYVVLDNMLADMIAELNITTNLVVIYDKKYQETLQYDWKRPFQELPIPVDFQVLKKGSLIDAHLKMLENTTKILLFVTDTLTIENYVMAAQRQIQENVWTWIVFTEDTLPFKCPSCGSVNMYWARVIKLKTSDTIRYFFDFLRSEQLTSHFDLSSNTSNHLQISYCLDIAYIALDYLVDIDPVLGGISAKKDDRTSSNDTKLRRFIEGNAFFDFGHFLPHEGHVYYQSVNAIILKIERIAGAKDSKISKHIADWNFDNGIIPLYEDGLSVDIRQLNHYRIVTILLEPFVQLGDSKDKYEGFYIDLLELIRAQLNFTYDIYLIPDGKFGIKESTGNWNGMVEHLVIGAADIALGPLSITSDRKRDIDFTAPIFDLVGTSILIRPGRVKYSLFKFIQVLDYEIWLYIFGAYMLTSILLWIFDRFSPYSYRNNAEEYKDGGSQRKFTLKESFWFATMSLTPQGGGESPRNMSSRFVVMSWWLFGFIFVASYTANLASFLTINNLERHVGDLDDLYKQYLVPYAPLKSSAAETYFKRMAAIEDAFYTIWKQMSLNESLSGEERDKFEVFEYPVSDKYTNMWTFMKQSQLPETGDEAIDRVLNSEEEFAFIGDSLHLRYAELTNCKLKKVTHEFNRKPYAIGLQDGSYLNKNFSNAILTLINNLTIDELKEKWWYRNPKRQECTNSGDPTRISIQNFGGVFIFILSGIIISLIMLATEFAYEKRKKRITQGTNT